MFTKTKISLSIVLLAILCVGNVYGFEQIDNFKEYSVYLEQNSQYVILHVYYNRHFKNTRQFKDFVEVIEDAEFKVKDFCKIILSDCEKDTSNLSRHSEDPFSQCQLIKDHNENRMLVGLKPTDEFFTLGRKRLQRAPTEVTFNHASDVYTVSDITDFVEKLVPNYATTVATQQELKEFLLPRYSPKLLYFTKQQEVPFNIRKLSTHFHCQVDDLSDDLIELYSITKFPTLLLLNWNYEKGEFDSYEYEGPQFDIGGYVRMKSFLAKYALPEPREDLMFHTIHMPSIKSDISVVDNEHDLWRLLDKATGWTIIEYSREKEPVSLTNLKSQYGPYFSYIQYLIGEGETSRVRSFMPRLNNTVDVMLSDNRFLFRLNDAQETLSNVSAFVKLDYLTLVVREQFGHLCSITEQTFFRGILFCLVLKESEYESFRDLVQGTEFKVGIVGTLSDDGDRLTAHNLEDAEYPNVYRKLEYLCRVKLQKLTEKFLNDPIREVTTAQPLLELCTDPLKMCIIALMTPEKSELHKTQLGYLKQIAKNYFQQFKFFWVKADCNQSLKDSINEHKVSLFVYNPSDATYTTMKTKLSKSNISKFLKLAHRKQLLFKSYNAPRQLINACLNQDETL